MATEFPATIPQPYHKPTTQSTAYPAVYPSYMPRHEVFPRPPSPPSSLSSSSYAGSGVTAPDLVALIHSKASETFSTIPLDRSIAIQAQTSGQLNATNRELAELQKEALARLAGMKRTVKEGLKTAGNVKKDLKYMEEKATALSRKVEQKYPQQYREARTRIAPQD